MNEKVLAHGYVVQELRPLTPRRDRIVLRDLVLLWSIGVYPHERLTRQRVVINLDIQVRNDPAVIKDDLANVLSYDEVIARIKQLAAGEHINLLETLAETIAEICLSYERVLAVRVRAEKLDVVPEAAGVGVEIERWQPGD